MELPAIREMRQQAMRKNMKRLIGEQEADTTIGRNYPFFQFGMADWSANLTEQINGRVDSRLSLALGSMLAGGEATVVINYNSFTPFTEKQQHYLWRYVNNEKRAVKQVALGKIATGATSSIYDPVVGAKVTGKLVAAAGGLGKLALMPASTVQVIGAEKALFKHLRNKSIAPPKHGIIFQHAAISTAPKKVRGKIARALATKITLAAKADVYTKRFIGPEVKDKFEKRLNDILAKAK